MIGDAGWVSAARGAAECDESIGRPGLRPGPGKPARHDAMTGLNLERFLLLLRADVGAWATLALIALVLALMTWTSWGSRRALRKCLVLSVAAHVALVIYGGSLPMVLLVRSSFDKSEPSRERIRQIRVQPLTEG